MLDDKYIADGREYKRVRLELELSQYEVASSIGISRYSLSNYECGKADMPLTVCMRLYRYYTRREKEIMDHFNSR